MIKFFWVWEDENQDEVDFKKAASNELDDAIGQIAVDIIETDYDIIILAPIAWISLENIDLSFNKSVLSISWIREKPEFFNNEFIVRNSECFWWKFVRNIILPENLDFDSINATMENNLLVITIKKLIFSSQEIKINRVES